MDIILYSMISRVLTYSDKINLPHNVLKLFGSNIIMSDLKLIRYQSCMKISSELKYLFKVRNMIH